MYYVRVPMHIDHTHQYQTKYYQIRKFAFFVSPDSRKGAFIKFLRIHVSDIDVRGGVLDAKETFPTHYLGLDGGFLEVKGTSLLYYL